MRKALLITAGIVVVVIAVVISPPGRLVLSNTCAVEGPINSARAVIQGSRFWSKQLEYLDEDLAFAREWPNRFARISADLDSAMAPTLRETDEVLERLYREHPELRLTPEERQAERLREQAIDAEARANELHMRHIFVERAQELELLRPLVLRRIDAGS